MAKKDRSSKHNETAEQQISIEITTEKSGADRQNPTDAKAKKKIHEQQQCPRRPKSEYVVGYKNPPMHTRFKPGQSGNSSGRPRKERSETIKGKFKEIFSKKIKASVNGKTKYIDGTQAALLQLRNMISKGDPKGLRIFVQLIKALDICNESDAPNHQLRGLFEALMAGPVDTPGPTEAAEEED